MLELDLITTSTVLSTRLDLIGVLEGVLALDITSGDGDEVSLVLEAGPDRRVELISDSGMTTEAEEALLLMVPLFLEVDLRGVVVAAAFLELFSF